MKNLRIVAPTILSLLTIAIAYQANAETFINPLSSGNLEVVTGNSCFVEFSSSGTLIRGGQDCDDINLHDAKTAIKAYLQEQSGSGSEHINNQENSSNPERMDDCTNVVSLKYNLQYNQVKIQTINGVMNWTLPNGRTGSCVFKEDGSVIIPAG